MVVVVVVVTVVVVVAWYRCIECFRWTKQEITFGNNTESFSW